MASSDWEEIKVPAEAQKSSGDWEEVDLSTLAPPAGPQTFGEGVIHGGKMLGLGIMDSVLDGGQAIRNKIGFLEPYAEKIGLGQSTRKILGLESNQANIAELQRLIDEERRKFANHSFAAKAGSVVGEVLPTVLLPGTKAIKAAGWGGRMAINAAQGGLIGAVQPTSGDESRIRNIGMGVGLGVAVSGAVSAYPLVKRGVKEAIGTTTGAGRGAVEEALKGGKDFTGAMRENISAAEVVENAKTALNKIKDDRVTAYQQKFAQISGNQKPIDTTPIIQELRRLSDKYNVKWKVDPKTKEVVFDTSRVAMGEKGAKDIADVIKTVQGWGSKAGDDTAVGLDVLKRKLADFYSDSSQARGFVSAMENKVAEVLRKEVPGYAEMTKGYSEATRLIKDIESGLMLRKQGMSGRIVADQTLRRLMSAMRENFEMRKTLVDALSNKGGVDVTGQVGGYAMSQIMPRGLQGKLGLGGIGALSYFHPSMAPVLMASSPRVAGEFLLYFGKVQRAFAPFTKPAAKYAAPQTPRVATGMYLQPNELEQ